ncbi:hypothetical protein [Cohnella caldifontis]|uniref:hypothetical protein n=1 Tax=Cohnella caldifontis TaxID=3027471 RepID=UPI0023EC1F62|nr:hypothetical protein [Cohnella sp. YIM B05605]
MRFTANKNRRPLIWAAVLLLIPIGAAVYCVMPRYEQYTAMGEIVPVRDIGVDGSVNFVYVREGITRNLFEKWTAARSYPDARFTPADPWVEDVLDFEMDAGEDLRDEVIQRAVDSAEQYAEENLGESERRTRLDSLIEQTADYYGDSIGLMLGIGLVEEALHENFSIHPFGTYCIAGTGTLEDDHTVGSVGAIRDKLRTAEQAGADYFFVPKDKDRYPYEGLSNEEEAFQVKQELNLHLRIVPVDTLEEAVDFLKNLPKSPLLEESRP